MKPFIESIREGRILIFDGAMGTQLEERGVHPGPEANLKSPEIVIDVHKAYIDAGADVLITNTLTANRIALERSGESGKIAEYNTAGVEICRKAAGDRAYVAGDISSTGQFMEPYGDYTEDQFHEVFSEQAKILEGAGADLIIIETMTALNETIVAVKACKSATSLPVIASMSFDPGAAGPRTMMGNDVESFVKKIDEAGADIIGTNCGGMTPEQMAEVIATMRGVTNKPIIAEPNAGVPELIDGQAQFNLGPDGFAEGAIKCVKSGAQLIGGCCGTSPAHIAALKKAIMDCK
ncbi:MAG: homocysteine S-methyltransferase family protein [Armatimonadota bacterium]